MYSTETGGWMPVGRTPELPRRPIVRSLPCRRVLVVHALLAALTLLSLTVLVLRNRAEFARTPRVALDAHPAWLAVALACEAIAFLTVVERSRWLLRRLGHRLDRRFLLRANLRRRALSTVVPCGSAPAAVLYTRDLAAARVPANDALYAIALAGIAGTAGTVAVLVPILGLLVLPAGGEVVAVRAGLLVALAVSVVLLLRRTRAGSRLVARYAPRRLRAFLVDARGHGIRPRDLAWPVAFAVAGNLAGIGGFYAALRAVRLQPGLEAAATARVVGSVATFLAPFFQGSGVVEGSMTAVLDRAGDDGGLALAGTLLYRLVQVWLPALLGLSLFASLPALPSRRVLAPAGIAAALALAAAATTLAEPPDLDAPLMALRAELTALPVLLFALVLTALRVWRRPLVRVTSRVRR